MKRSIKFLILSFAIFNSVVVAGPKYDDFKANGFADVAKRVIPGTVSIRSLSEENISSNQYELMERLFNDPMLRKFFGLSEEAKKEQQKKNVKDTPKKKVTGLGSGFLAYIKDGDAYIVTCRHVVDDADELIVSFEGGELGISYKASLVYKADLIDIAILKVKLDSRVKTLALPLGDSDKVETGNFAIAFGSPYGFSNTMTTGIISATDRNKKEFLNLGMPALIQTTASINMGNSGGPLTDIDGNVIGVNCMIVSANSNAGGNIGIGFAIPINLIKKLIDKSVTNGNFERGYLGVEPDRNAEKNHDENDEESLLKAINQKGAVIKSVTKGSPAEAVGLKEGDSIMKVDGRDIINYNHLACYISVIPAGEEVELTVKKKTDKKEYKVKVKLSDKDAAFSYKYKGSKEVMGMTIANATKELLEELDYDTAGKGILILDVKKNSIASKKGLQIGDFITEINNTAIDNVDSFIKIYEKVPNGKTITLRIENKKVNMVEKKYIVIEKQ